MIRLWSPAPELDTGGLGTVGKLTRRSSTLAEDSNIPFPRVLGIFSSDLSASTHPSRAEAMIGAPQHDAEKAIWSRTFPSWGPIWYTLKMRCFGDRPSLRGVSHLGIRLHLCLALQLLSLPMTKFQSWQILQLRVDLGPNPLLCLQLLIRTK